MRPQHEEFTGRVAATANEVFAHLDDQTRLSAHMTKRSWKMGWGKMDVILDQQGGRAAGSHIVLRGRVFGVRLYLDEVVIERDPPVRKTWETVGEPHLLVIGAYRMGFEITPMASDVNLRVAIDYQLPTHGIAKLLGRVFGRAYAKWCTRQMVHDAQRSIGTAPRAEHAAGVVR